LFKVKAEFSPTGRRVDAVRATAARLHKGSHFFLDIGTLASGTKFTFETKIGDIDLLGEVAGIGNYADALSR
jgi:excinuclease UvrABC helicase subunit UvrB